MDQILVQPEFEHDELTWHKAQQVIRAYTTFRVHALLFAARLDGVDLIFHRVNV